MATTVPYLRLLFPNTTISTTKAGRSEPLQQHNHQQSHAASCLRLPLPPPQQHSPLSPSSSCRSPLAVSHKLSCAYLRRAPPTCASHTRIMSPISSRRAVAVAPPAKQKTLPLSRIGSAEHFWGGKSEILEVENAWPTSTYSAGYMTSCESGNGRRMGELIDDLEFALDRRHTRDSGDRKSRRSDLSVWQNCFV